VLKRMLRAARFDASLYRELQEDPVATVQALGVVLLTALSLALAGVLGFHRGEGALVQAEVAARAFAATVAAWVLVSLLAYLVGRGFLHRDTVLPALLRAIGFAGAPGVLYVLLAFGGALSLAINAAILAWCVFALGVALQGTLGVSRLAGFWMAVAGVFVTLVVRRFLL